jgi:hypothetical protein
MLPPSRLGYTPTMVEWFAGTAVISRKFVNLGHNVIVHDCNESAPVWRDELVLQRDNVLAVWTEEFRDVGRHSSHLDSSHLDRSHLDRSHLDRSHLDRSHLDSSHLDRSHLDRSHLDSSHLDSSHLDSSHLCATVVIAH